MVEFHDVLRVEKGKLFLSNKLSLYDQITLWVNFFIQPEDYWH